MKLWKRAGPVALSLALCAGLVLPALAHTVTIDGQTDTVATVQAGVDKIEASTSQSGTITMDRDDPVTEDGVKISGGNVTLDLNGHSITNGDRHGSAITVEGGGLTLQDSSEDKSGKVEATGGHGSGVYVSGGTANILGGKVEATGETGQGVYVADGGTANISGGKVEATGDYGKGVYVDDGTANISGGKVEATHELGDGVDVAGSGSKATITGGTVNSNGYGVSVSYGGEATISGTATVTGDVIGVDVSTGGEATISGGANISGNTIGVYVRDGEATISGTATVTGKSFGLSVSDGGTAEIRGGKVEATGEHGEGVSVDNGTVKILGGKVEASGNGVYVSNGGTAEIKGGKVEVTGRYGSGVHVLDGTANILGGEVKATGEDGNGVFMESVVGDAANAIISGGTVSGNGTGVNMGPGCTAEISDDATVSGETGVHMYDGTFTMNGGTVGSTVKDGAAVDGTGTITLKGGTIYGSVPDRVDISNVTVKAAPYVPPTPGPDPASDPLTRPAAARTLLEELFRRAGGSGDLWTWAVENGLIDEDGDGDEIVTVALLRSILTRYAQAFGGNAVAAEDLTTLTGEDTDIVGSCRAVLNEFFGE